MYTAYLIAASVLEGCTHVASLFKRDILYLWHIACSSFAEVLVEVALAVGFLKKDHNNELFKFEMKTLD